MHRAILGGLLLGCIALAARAHARAPATSAAWLGAALAASETPINVVIFLVDDVGPDQLALFDAINPYQGEADPVADHLYVQAPHLEALAASGVTFLNAYSATVCSPARASLLTGRSSRYHGVGAVVRHDFVGALAEFGDPGFELTTLAELAHGAGYRASLVGKWHLGLPTTAMDPLDGNDEWLGWEHIPLRGHWDDYRCTFRNLNTQPYPPSEDRGYYLYYWDDNGDVQVRDQYATVLQLDEALDVCNTTAEPFVVCVAPNACHGPWDELPPAELVNTPEYLAEPHTFFRNHCAMLEALDSTIGGFLAGFDPAIAARTLIVVMGDNGADQLVLRSAREQEGLDLGPTYNFLLDEEAATAEGRFKMSMYERGIRVPLIASFPGIDQPGRTSLALVDITDLFATVADVMGVDPGETDGISFLPLLQDASMGLAEHARQSILEEYFEPNGAVGDAVTAHRLAFSLRLADGRRFKIHRVRELALGTVRDELYLLQDAGGNDVDPYEMNPLSKGPGEEFFDEYVEIATALSPPRIQNYCVATPNSTGLPAIMFGIGVPSVAANDLILAAGVCPPGQPGFFYYGPRAVEFPFGNGVRCVDGGQSGTVRLPITQIDALGTLSWVLNLANPPSANGQITPGSIWRFQAWFRDPFAGGAGFDFSDGLAITFGP